MTPPTMRKTLLLLLLTAVFCGAFARKTPQVAPAPQVPDSLRGFYLFTEGIKQAFICLLYTSPSPRDCS